jgi:inorganic phosphate transporter, PiT family
LIFDFLNGMNDAANSIATIVATRVLSLRTAAFLAMFFNIIAAFVFTVAVAKTVGKGIIDPSYVTTAIILAGLIGGAAWVYITSHFGMPISASHSLIGGLIGSVLFGVGPSALILTGIIKVVLFIFLAPIIGLMLAITFTTIIFGAIRKLNPKPNNANKHFKWLQLISSSAFSLNHGANDAQKTMGVITLALFVNGYLGQEFYVPFWVILVSHFAIGLGTLIGGWKVVKTMGIKLTKLRPVHGFCAETAGALTIFGCSLAGIPVSTTHVICGSIAGVGVTKRASSVKWNRARPIVWAWLLTIPVSAIIGGLTYGVIQFFV